MLVLSMKENMKSRETPGTRKRSIFLRSFPSATASNCVSADLMSS